MTTFIFSFHFLGTDYKAACHVIYPPPDKQFHITVDDEYLRFQYGDIHIISLRDGQFQWGIPPQPKGREFMATLAKALQHEMAVHPEY